MRARFARPSPGATRRPLPQAGEAKSARAFIAAVALTACAQEPLYDFHIEGGDPDRGRAAIVRYQCGACHVIPDVPGPAAHVGPSLDSFARHAYIAGKFPNTPEVLLRFLPNAPSLVPETGMPAIAMSDAEARDMAAYLYQLK